MDSMVEYVHFLQAFVMVGFLYILHNLTRAVQANHARLMELEGGSRWMRELQAWRDVEYLRHWEGDSVHVLCDNPDGPCAVEVNGGYTDYETVRVEGQNVFEALRNAHNLKLRYEISESRKCP